jgi:hypothetical protein
MDQWMAEAPRWAAVPWVEDVGVDGGGGANSSPNLKPFFWWRKKLVVRFL